jgi:hypothetical protein
MYKDNKDKHEKDKHKQDMSTKKKKLAVQTPNLFPRNLGSQSPPRSMQVSISKRIKDESKSSCNGMAGMGRAQEF